MPGARRTISILGLAAFLVASASNCFAQSEIKDVIFHDCPAALESFNKLSLPDKEKLVPFLREVLKLKIGAPGEALVALPPKPGLGIPGGEADLGSIWRSFGSDREVEAKRCSLKLLDTAPTLALSAVPEILGLASDATLSDDFIELVDSTTFNISNALAGSAIQEQVNELAPAALDHIDTLGDNVLAFVPRELALQALWNQSAKFDSQKQTSIVEFLAWFDPTGNSVQSSVFSNAKILSEQASFANIILSKARCPTARTARYLRDLGASEDIELKKQSLAALQQLVQTALRETPCPEAADAISGSDLLGILLEDLQPADAREAERLTIARPLLSGRNNSRVPVILRTLLKSTAPAEINESDPATAALIALGNQSRDIILETLKTDNEIARTRASLALAKLNLNDAKKLRPFLPYLTDPNQEVRANIYLAIRPVATELRSELNKLRSTTKQNQADFVALALQPSSDPATPPEEISVARKTSELRDLVLSTQSSPSDRQAALIGLGKSQLDPAFWAELFREGINRNVTDNFSAVSDVEAPAVVQAAEEIFTNCSAVQKPLAIRLVGHLGQKASPFEARLVDLSASKNLPTRYEALVALLRTSPQPRKYLPAVEALLKTREARRLSNESFPASAKAALKTLEPDKSPLQARFMQSQILNFHHKEHEEH